MADPKLNVKIGADTKEFDKALDHAEGEVQGFGKSVGKLGGMMAAAFTTAGVLAALKGLKEAFISTEQGADRFELAVATAKGSLQGLMRTVSTGDFGNIIRNIQSTEIATRNLTAAFDELEDIAASNALQKATLKFSIGKLRVAAAGTTDDKLKQQFLGEAINLQRQLTAIEVDEQKKRIDAQWDFYLTQLGQGQKYNELLKREIPKIAANWAYFGSEAYQAMLDKTVTDLTYRKGATGLTQSEQAELNQAIQATAILRDYKKLKDEIGKKGQWNEFVGELARMIEIEAEGEQALIRMTGTFTSAGERASSAADEIRKAADALEMWNNVMVKAGEKKPALPVESFTTTSKKYGTTSTTFADPTELAKAKGASEQLTLVTQEQISLAMELGDTFSNVFMAATQGWEAMTQAIIDSIKRIAAEILAKAAAWAILNLITSGGVGTFGSFMGLTGAGNGGSGKIMNWVRGLIRGPDASTFQLRTEVSGKNLAIIASRGQGQFNSGT